MSVPVGPVRRMVYHPAPAKRRGRPLWWALSSSDIASLAGVTPSAVLKAVDAGTLDPLDPLALADWIRRAQARAARRGRGC